MKVLIAIWILLGTYIFAQTNCDNYKSILEKVDKHYSELSQQPFHNYIKYTLSQNDSLKVSLYNVKGELVYQVNYGLLDADTYAIKFFNPQCPGIYFASTKIGNQQAFKKSIQITSDEFPSKEIEIKSDSSSSIINGIWKRSYTEKFIPAIKPQLIGSKIEYQYKYDLTVNFSNDSYKIISERTDLENSGKEFKSFKGKFKINTDTLKLYENYKLKNIFCFNINEDTLSISNFVTKDKATGALSMRIENNIPYNTELKLIGKYHK